MTPSELLYLGVLLGALGASMLIVLGFCIVVLLVTALTDWFPGLRTALRRVYATHWLYRGKDPDICCCGGTMGQGCEGGCRSMLEYAITSYVEGPRHVESLVDRLRRYLGRSRAGRRHPP